MKQYFLYVMAAAYILAGANHFWHPGFYIKMVRNFLPYPVQIVYVSGIAEILCGIGLMIPATRQISAWCIILLLVAIFPANINMLINHNEWDIPKLTLYLRLPLQFLLIWLAYVYTRV